MRRIGLAVVGGCRARGRRARRGDPPWHKARARRGTASSTAGEPSGPSSHFGGLGSNRYDFWRVGLIEFERHPVQGIGVDNFLVPYLQQRRSQRGARCTRTASFIRLLSQTGVVGTALFVGVPGVHGGRPCSGSRPAASGTSPGSSPSAARSGSCTGSSTGCGRCPSLGVLGMALLGAACGLAPRRDACARRGAGALAARSWRSAGARWPRSSPPRASRCPGLRSATSSRRRPAGVPTRPRRSRRSSAAHSLNPLDDQADLRRRGDREPAAPLPVDAAAVSRRPCSRSPDDWYANLELGIAASLTGRHDLAAASLQRARATGSRASRSSGRSCARSKPAIASTRMPSTGSSSVAKAEDSAVETRSEWGLLLRSTGTASRWGGRDLDRGVATSVVYP